MESLVNAQISQDNAQISGNNAQEGTRSLPKLGLNVKISVAYVWMDRCVASMW